MKEKNRFWRMVDLGMKQINDPYYQGFAAQISFYLMLSLVPTVLLISQVLFSMLGATLDDAVGWIIGNADGVIASTLKNLLTYKSGGFSNIIYIIIALWAASRAQFSMMRINNFMNSEGWSTGKGYWHERFRAVINMAVTLIVIILCLAVMAYGGKIFELISNFPEIWVALRWPIGLGLYFLMISFNYYRMPEKKVRYREIIPGSIFASVGLLIVTLFYSFFTSKFSNYDIIYGSLATIVALMFWFFFLSWVFILGMLFNKVWKDTKR